MGYTEERPWGKYEILLDESYTKVKKITVYPDGELSLQYHNKREEFWVVVGGSGMVTIDEKYLQVKYNSVVNIPIGAKHTIHNNSDTDLIFVEIQTGDYFGEDDIVRLEDKYDRI